jgi:hypothetical protein
MSTIDLLILQRMFRRLSEDLKCAEDRIAFLQDEEECARISLQRAKTEKPSQAMAAYSRNSIERIEEEEEHSTETVSQQQEQLSWVQVQLAVAEEEHGRLRQEWHCIENQIKNRHSPC